jgi:hypothetical protein
MYLATCAQRLLCVFGLGMMMSACDNTTEPTTQDVHRRYLPADEERLRLMSHHRWSGCQEVHHRCCKRSHHLHQPQD